MRLNIKSILITASLLFLFLLVTLSSCKDQNSAATKSSLLIDSLIQQAEDSVSHNFIFSRKQLSRAMSLTSDSLRFHEILYKYAFTYVFFNQYDTAATFGRRILNYCAKKPASTRVNELQAMSYNLIGNYHSQISAIDSAIWYYKKSLKYYELTGKSGQIPNLYINLADMFIRKGDYAASVFYNREALLLSDSLHTTREMGFPIYFSLGQAYMELRDYELSDSYYRLAEKYYEERSLSEKFTYCNNRGNYFYYKEDYSEALLWFKKARALVASGDFEYYISLCDVNLGDVYLNLGESDSAKHCLDRSYDYFSRQKNSTALYYIATIRAGIALRQNNMKLARDFLKVSNNPAGIELNMVTIRNKYMQDYYEKIGDYKQAYFYQSKNIAQNDSVRTERAKKRIAELDMRYKLDKTLIKKDAVIREQKSEVGNLRLNRFLWILACFLTLIVAVFIFLYMRRQRDLQWMKHFDQITKLRMQNIRNRISPHFIFNILNNEISFIEETKRSDLFVLVKLLRRSLEMTEQLSVSLSQELEFVDAYIQLERKSLGEDFRLDWNVDESISQDSLYIPPMIIQIPVENAIKHALRPKEGLKVLSVRITSENQGVKIVVQDNGSGYKPEEISQTKGTGTGMKVLYQSIQLFNSKNTGKVSFQMHSITDGGIRGARAEIFVPDNYKFDL